MKLWFKRAVGLAMIAAALILLASHAKALLDWPHFYPDLGQVHLANLLFLALMLFALALAWISAAYLLLNCQKQILHFLIPAASFCLMIFVAWVSMTHAVGQIPCSYTDDPTACREEFRSGSFSVDGRALYPPFPSGELTSYARYEKGEVLAETLTRSYELEQFNAEAARVKALDLSVFRPEQDPREREVLCYQLVQGGTVWQVLVVPKTKTVTYSRFRHPEQLPSFAPQPSEEEQLTGDN